MIAFIDERVSLLQNEIVGQIKVRQDCVNLLEGELESDFPKLQDCNKAESHERQEKDGLILKKLVEEADTIMKQISIERRAREHSEEEILGVVKNMIESTKTDLNIERQQREQSEE